MPPRYCFRVLTVYGRGRVPPFDLTPNFLDASYVPDKIDLISVGNDFVSKHIERYSTVRMFVKDVSMCFKCGYLSIDALKHVFYEVL